jgi:hypothetical protein
MRNDVPVENVAQLVERDVAAGADQCHATPGEPLAEP